MNKFARNIGVALFSMLSASSYAKTFEYDFTAINSLPGPIQYPNLNFNQPKAVVFKVNKDPLSPDVQINSLEVSFPNAAKLVATGFRKIEPDLYRAIVDDAWIYRQVFVDVRGVDFNRPLQSNPRIEVSISEQAGFIQPEVAPKGQPLFSVNGILRDITVAKIADVATTTIDSKPLTLSLKDTLTYAPVENQINGPREGFAIEALWQGKGQKTIYVPVPVPQEDWDRLTAIAITIKEMTIPGGKDYFFSIKYKEENGIERTTNEQLLRPLLNTVFGTTPPYPY